MRSPDTDDPWNDLNVVNKRKKSNESAEEAKSDDLKYKMSVDNCDVEATTCDKNSERPSTSLFPPPKKIHNRKDEWLSIFANWSHVERLNALEALISSGICEIPQMRHLLSLIEPQLQRDFISLLPKELSLYVLSFLEPRDVLNATQTCRYWRVLCEDNILWREKCREEGLLDDNELFSDFMCKRACLSVNSGNSRSKSDQGNLSPPIAESPPPQNESLSSQNTFYSSEYKLQYLHHKTIESNWRYGQLNYDNSNQDVDQPPVILANDNALPSASDNHNNNNNNNQPANANRSQANDTTANKQCKPRKLKEILHLKGHEDHVITCLQFNAASNLIISGSDDNTLKVWCGRTGRCLRTLNGHTGGVWSSQLSSEDILISGSTDRTLRVWDVIAGTCLHVLYGHTSTVRCMSLHGDYVVSGSRDATLRVWNIKTGQCDHVLVGHLAAVRCVQFNGKRCVSGAYDFLVKVWDPANETCLHTLDGHTNRVYSLQFDGTHIVSGSLDTSIRVWNANTGKLKHTLIGHQSLTSGMQLRNNILVSGNADSTVKVWDINTGQCLQTLSGINKHQSAVTCLQFNSKFVITSSDDGTVKLWDLKTGEFIRNLINLPSGGSGGVVWRIRSSHTKLVCAVGSRNGTEETKLLVLDFETPNYDHDHYHKQTCDFFNSPFREDNFAPIMTTFNCLNHLANCQSVDYPLQQRSRLQAQSSSSIASEPIPSLNEDCTPNDSATGSASNLPQSSSLVQHSKMVKTMFINALSQLYPLSAPPCSTSSSNSSSSSSSGDVRTGNFSNSESSIPTQNAENQSKPQSDEVEDTAEPALEPLSSTSEEIEAKEDQVMQQDCS